MGRRESARERAFCSPEFFAEELALARERAGLSQGDLAQLTHCDRSLISRIESSDRVPQEDFVRACDRLLDTDGRLLRFWRRVPWHQDFERPDGFQRFFELEAAATMHREYHVSLVGGLLQTPDYAHALFTRNALMPDQDLIEERMRVRMGRQRRFLEDPNGPMLVVILSEAVLRRTIGGPAVMTGQLRHLLDVAQRPNIVLQVAPFSLAERTPVNTSMTLITLPGGQEYLYSESLGTGHLINDDHTIAMHARRFDRLRGDCLSAPDTARLVQRILEGLLNQEPEDLPVLRPTNQIVLPRQQRRPVPRSSTRLRLRRGRPGPEQ
ncbi:helix-turn-helix domain-containing protein [Kitasatospora sp. NA04385]|uniref:helix-turn-helix domain-containing protein n=1 Tax=Kitasatospora sp. NA04385 TaxID=2742135 RepID=UPI00159230D2|nr:helix-turn-helix transcriptional regulator [Kitasatospora sp. NA04385]QKW20421.1 helix-turn-helix domain-containing protein [Kitasatospora sp. NA04385]